MPLFFLTIKLITMTLIGFLVLLAIAAICGAIGQSLAGYDLGGCLVSIIVGFIGAYSACGSPGKWDSLNFLRSILKANLFRLYGQ
jgi:uncharacterized membrane protein YeaQ/YmgE (transglycosylase-associated protein family)